MQDTPDRPAASPASSSAGSARTIPIITDQAPGAAPASSPREVRAAVPDEAALQTLTRALLDAGIDRAALTVGGADSAAAATQLEAPASEADERQVRTLATSTAGIAGALIGGAVATAATAGAAAPVAGAAVAAAVGAGGAAHLGTRQAEGAREQRHDAQGARGRLVISIAVRDEAQEQAARRVIAAHGDADVRLI